MSTTRPEWADQALPFLEDISRGEYVIPVFADFLVDMGEQELASNLLQEASRERIRDSFLYLRRVGSFKADYYNHAKNHVLQTALGRYFRWYVKEQNAKLFSSLNLDKAAQDAINEFTRIRMREDGFFRRIMPPLPITDDVMYSDVITGDPVAVVDQAPNAPRPFNREPYKPKRRRLKAWRRQQGHYA